VPFDKRRPEHIRTCALSLSKRGLANRSLAGLASKVALRLHGAMRMRLLRLVIDVILALATLLSRQSLTEFALGLVLGCLFLAGFVTSAHEAILTADPPC
jgi:hypothetical protein